MRRVIGLIAAGLGAFLLASGLLLRFYVAGRVVRFPLNEYQITALAGKNVTYFSPSLLKDVAGVTMRVTKMTEGAVASGTASRAVWTQFSYSYDATNEVAYQSLTQRSAFGQGGPRPPGPGRGDHRDPPARARAGGRGDPRLGDLARPAAREARQAPGGGVRGGHVGLVAGPPPARRTAGWSCRRPRQTGSRSGRRPRRPRAGGLVRRNAACSTSGTGPA